MAIDDFAHTVGVDRAALNVVRLVNHTNSRNSVDMKLGSSRKGACHRVLLVDNVQ